MISEQLMAAATWDLTLDDGTPRNILDRLADQGALLVVTSEHLDYQEAAAITAPLYRGVLISRTAMTTGTGQGLAWYMGTPGATAISTDADQGGYMAGSFSGNNLAFCLNQVASKNAVTPGIAGGNGATCTAVYQTNARTILDRIVRPTFAVEWRLNTDMSLDADSAAGLFGTSSLALIARDVSGRDPSMPGFQLAAATPTLDLADYRNRIVVNYGGSWISTGLPTDAFRDPAGNQLEIAHFDQSSGSSANATDLMNADFAAMHHVTRALAVDLNDYLVRDHVASPSNLVGGYVDVFDPDIGFYDLTNPVDFRGLTIYPAAVRCIGVNWPIQRGLGVYLDNRHQGGSFVDVTDYVAWEDGQATTLNIGALPKRWTGKRRPYAP